MFEEKINDKIKYLTFGSPIMDLIVDVDEYFIKKNKLKLDTTSHAQKDDNIFAEIDKLNPIQVAGGCSYNAIRVMNWMLQSKEKSGKVGCLGSIGDDEYGRIYSKLLKQEKIEYLFQTVENDTTGVCATICEGRDRCHRTDLGASIKISEKYVDSVWDKIKDIELIYTELYILSHKEKILYQLAELCLTDDKYFGFNFPSIGFLDAFGSKILDIITYGDILFANKEEAKHFVSNVLREKYTDVSDLCQILAKLPKKNINKPRVFIVTCGPEPAHIAVYNHKLEKFDYIGAFLPWQIPNEKIIDTNGAGDSFAGGFLAAFVQRKRYEICILSAHWAAKEIIQVRGCEIPEKIKVPTEIDLSIQYLDDKLSYSDNAIA